MSWPLPQPAALALNASTFLAGELGRIYLARTGQLGTPDTTSPNSVAGVYARQSAMALFDVYLAQRRIADEMMPDTAKDWLPRHAALWGVPQDQPVKATGNAIATGTIALPLPSGIALTAPGGAQYVTTAAAAIGFGGTVDVPVQAVTPGVAGNLAAGTLLTLVSPIAGLSPQVLVVDSNGVTDGQDLESLDSWQSRIVARIRRRGSGGSRADYEQWMQEVLPGSIVGVSSAAVGVVTVAFAMPTSGAPRVPTTAELTAATAYLTDANIRKPLCAQVNAIAATLSPIAVTLHLIPDTVATRSAASAALALFFQTDATVGIGELANSIGGVLLIKGGDIDVSRMDDAISSGSGEYAHDRTLPAADIAGAMNVLPVLGAVTFI